MPDGGVLPLRCAIDMLVDQCVEVEDGEDRERRIDDTYAIFRLLIQRGSDVETPSVGIGDGVDTKTPLLALCEGTRIAALIRCLIEKGANVKVADNRGFTPLHLCMISTRYESRQDVLARLLLDRGADVNAVTNEGDTPLHFGAAGYAMGEVRVLLERGADVKAKNGRGESALHAMFTGHFVFSRKNVVDCLEALLAADADACLKDESGQTPFMMFLESAYNHRILTNAISEDVRIVLHELCSLFAAYGIRLDQASTNGNTLAHVAVHLDDVELLRMYVKHGGEVDALYPSAGTPLNISLRENETNILPELLRLDAHLDAGRDGENLFRQFVYHGNAGTVEGKRRKSIINCRTTRR